MQDKLFAKPMQDIVEFTFDDRVVKVFDDMIKRSVPGYRTVVAMIGMMAQKFAKDDSFIYDLGCSLGACSLAMSHSLTAKNCMIQAVDNSAAMLEKFSDYLQQHQSIHNIHLLHDDIENLNFEPASIVVMNFTLQFIEQSKRQKIIQKIYDALLPGGIFILSEKIKFADEHVNELYIDMYHEFKKANGYSDLEISQKRTALENILIPETLHEHKQRILNAGFASIDVWFQCFNFASLCAIKK